MHDEIVDEVSRRVGVAPWIINMVADSVFTGIQQLTQNPGISNGVDLGDLRLQVDYYYTVTMMHRLLLDHDIWFTHPADNYTVTHKWQMIQLWESTHHAAPRLIGWRRKQARDMDVDYSLISEDYDRYLMDKRTAYLMYIRKRYDTLRRFRKTMIDKPKPLFKKPIIY